MRYIIAHILVDIIDTHFSNVLLCIAMTYDVLLCCLFVYLSFITLHCFDPFMLIYFNNTIYFVMRRISCLITRTIMMAPPSLLLRSSSSSLVPSSSTINAHGTCSTDSDLCSRPCIIIRCVINHTTTTTPCRCESRSLDLVLLSGHPSFVFACVRFFILLCWTHI